MSRTNKRRHPRVRGGPVAAHVRLGEQATACMIENISQGGLFLRTEKVLEEGTAIVVTLVKPGMKASLQLTGKVATAVTADQAAARGVPPGMGVAFDPVPELAAKRLGDLLTQLGAPDEFAPAQAYAAPADETELNRLRVQLSGMLMQLGDMQQLLMERERELERVRAELEQLKARSSGSADAKQIVRAAREQLERLEKSLG